MSHISMSHWGVVEFAHEQGKYTPLPSKSGRLVPAVVLTEAGEVLIRADKGSACAAIAIVLPRGAGQLARPQQERVLRAWDIARSVCAGQEEEICLQPLPHHWRFARTEYLTLEEWAASAAPDSRAELSPRDDRDARL